MDTKSIFVAIVGQPNVGKSTLLNQLVGEKVAIVTKKPQTTRSRINGILTQGKTQYVFIDTPGMHVPRTKLGQRMTKTVKESMQDGDAVAMMFFPELGFNESEDELIAWLKSSQRPAVAVINKIDLFNSLEALEQRKQEINSLGIFKDIIMVSATNGQGLEELMLVLESYAKEGPHYFSSDSYTDLPEKQLVAEIVREKLLLNLQEEIPHGTAVEVERFKERKQQPIIDIDVTIYCEKKSHKGIIIGKEGQMLKKIGSQARVDCEEMLGSKVNLQCWVKIKDDWRDNEYLLNSFGFAK